MNILFLSPWYPYPPNNGSKLRIYNLLRGLAAEHEVRLITFAGQAPGDGQYDLRDLCSRVHVVPYQHYNPRSLRSLVGLFSPKPRVLVDTYSLRMEQTIRREVEQQDVDIVIASEWATAAYHITWQGTPAMFEDVEIRGFIDAVQTAPSVLSQQRRQLTVMKLTAYLRSVLPCFEVSTTVSQLERAALHDLAPRYSRVEVVPNCVSLVDYEHITNRPQQHTLIFAGSLSFSANYEAMVWFLSEVYPLIKTRIPGIRLIITGDHKGLPLPTLDGVTLTGLLEDVRPVIASAWISIAPIRSGSGTRLKILEAMALGAPVVSTTKGAEGLEAEDGEHLLIADEPKQFADAVARLCLDDNARARLVDQAYQLVQERYDWRAIMPRFLRLVERVARG